mmetsp:Transcript_20548/g.58709  ORF Transcript_20548/g.58709 Transcript_20548/m.58709 type:complete len:142 (+) Transcript_20548:1684-2109(+)
MPCRTIAGPAACGQHPILVATIDDARPPQRARGAPSAGSRTRIESCSQVEAMRRRGGTRESVPSHRCIRTRPLGQHRPLSANNPSGRPVEGRMPDTGSHQAFAGPCSPNADQVAAAPSLPDEQSCHTSRHDTKEAHRSQEG